MVPYLDVGYLLTLLVRTTGSAVANERIRHVDAPFALNLLHRLQTETFLLHLQNSRQVVGRARGAEAARLWNNYLAEGVFQIAASDWEFAFNTAIAWTSHFSQASPPPLLILHPVLAALARADHFFSFDPRSRALARAAGLELVPADL